MSSEFKHQSDDSEWITPAWIVDKVTATYGGKIDLDPASSDTANEKSVHALDYFTKADDGLSKEWHGKIFLNCPWGYTIQNGKQKSSQMVWLHYLKTQILRNEVKAIITINQAAVSQSWFEYLVKTGFVCFPFRRISFIHPETLHPVTGNKYASAITLLRGAGMNQGDWVNTYQEFIRQFSTMGTVMQRVTTW